MNAGLFTASRASMAKKRYLEVTEALLERIEGGEWVVGDTLPTENDLCGVFGVSRSTIRLALQRLDEWGMVSRRPKRGTVLESDVPKRVYQQQIGTLEQLDDFSRQTELKIKCFNEVAGSTLSEEYKIEGDLEDRWVEYVGWRTWLGEKKRISWTRVAFPGLYEGVKDRIGVVSRPTYKILEDAFGFRIVTIDQEVRACGINHETADTLKCRVGEPALEVIRIMYDETGHAIVLAHSVHLAEAVSLRMRMGEEGLKPST